jgi:hypothetical protein
MKKYILFCTALALMLAASLSSAAAGLCAGQKAGTFIFFDQEIARDKTLPAPVTQLNGNKPMFALACLPQAVGPQASGGKTFRVVLYVDGRQTGGVFRPQLSVPRKDIIIGIDESFDLDTVGPGEHEFRLQAATETPSGKIDVEVDMANNVAYLQELRKAGYLADSKVRVTK